MSLPDLGPKPLLGYTASILARVAERRSDEVFLTACEAHPRTGTFAIGGELVVMKRSSNRADPLFRPDEARALAPVGPDPLGTPDKAGDPGPRSCSRAMLVYGDPAGLNIPPSIAEPGSCSTVLWPDYN